MKSFWQDYRLIWSVTGGSLHTRWLVNLYRVVIALWITLILARFFAKLFGHKEADFLMLAVPAVVVMGMCMAYLGKRLDRIKQLDSPTQARLVPRIHLHVRQARIALALAGAFTFSLLAAWLFGLSRAEMLPVFLLGVLWLFNSQILATPSWLTSILQNRASSDQRARLRHDCASPSSRNLLILHVLGRLPRWSSPSHPVIWGLSLTVFFRIIFSLPPHIIPQSVLTDASWLVAAIFMCVSSPILLQPLRNMSSTKNEQALFRLSPAAPDTAHFNRQLAKALLHNAL